MSQRDRDHDDAPPVEDVDAEDVQLHVADPDDYNETRRLRDIYDARNNVREAFDDLEYITGEKERKNLLANLGMAVSTYYAELEPLLEATDADTSLSAGPWNSLEECATCVGLRVYEDGYEPATPQHLLFAYRKLNRLLEELKPLVTEDSTDTWEV